MSRHPIRRRESGTVRYRPAFEILEDRSVPSVGAGGLYNAGEWISPDPLVQGFYGGLVDSTTGRAYFGGSHGSAATLDLNGPLPSLVSSSESGTYGAWSAGVIDTSGPTHYLYIAQKGTGVITQYSLGTVAVPIVPQATGLTVPIPDGGILSSAALDAAAGCAYFCGIGKNGSSASQNYVVRLNLSNFSIQVEWLQGIPGPANVDCAIDTANNFLYVAAGLASYPFVEQVNIASFTDGATVGTYFDLGSDLTRQVASFTGTTTVGSNFITAVSSTANLAVGEFVTSGPFPLGTMITAVDTVHNTVTVLTPNNQGASSGGAGVPLVARLMPTMGGMTLVFDQAHNRLYLGTYTYDPNTTGNPNDPANSVWPFSQATIVQIDPTGGGSGFASAVVKALDLQPGERDLSAAVLDQATGDLVLSSDNTFPAHVYRVHVGDGTIPMTEIGSIALNYGSYTANESDGVDDSVHRAPPLLGEAYVRSGVFYNGYAYFGTDSDGAQVIKIALTNPSATLTSISITPANATVAPGTTTPFIATGTFSDGTTAYVTGGVGGSTTSSWASTNPAVAALVAWPVNTGQFTASGTGTTVITETIGSVTGSTSLQVGASTTPAVTPSQANLPQNATILVITGSNFSPTPTQDTVTFNLGAAGTVTAATTTQLTIALTTAPNSLGPLTATVTASGFSSGNAVQVATVVAPGTLAVGPPALPAGAVGGTYRQTVSASGGSGAGFRYQVTSGSLPPGLALDPRTGLLSGMPCSPAGSPFAFTVTATDSAGNTGSQTYSLAIASPLGASPQAVYVENIYGLVLQRVADPGASGWVGLLTQGGTAFAAVVAAIENSTEYLDIVVTDIYQHYLSRGPDPAGLAGWVAALQNGMTIEQVIQGFIASPEFYQVQGGGTNAGFVTVFYQDILGRQPDQAGFAAWVNALNNGTVTPASMAWGFLHSPEYEGDLISSYYQQFLRRTVDPAGLAGWTQAMQAGLIDQAILATLLGSPEGVADWS